MIYRQFEYTGVCVANAQDIGMPVWYVSNSFVLVVILLGVHKNELILLCHVKVLIIGVWGNC